MKKAAKHFIDLISLIIVLPLYLVQFAAGLLVGRDVSFWSVSQCLSLVPGLTGNYLRKNYYRLSMTKCSRDSAILFGTIFSQADTEIGGGVYIGPNCNIGKCMIENNCTIGSNVHIMSGKKQHGFDDIDLPVQEQAGVFEKIRIGEDTWVGNAAIIMANVGKKCIVGAGAVVTKDVEDFCVVAGNPAKVIKKRA